MFLNSQPEIQRNSYFSLLKLIGSLSNLFSDGAVPYLYYRVAENAFCRAFEAENLSRSDCSADAKKSAVGIGLKTFLNNNGKTWQKVAEFNSERHLYSDYEKDSSKKLVKTVSELRNERIRVTKAVHGINNIIYHCVTRSEGEFFIFEESMDVINIDKISKVKSSKNNNIISFSDNLNEYSFNLSKSTLFKRFKTPSMPFIIPVEILENPFDALEKLFDGGIFRQEEVEERRIIILPLYSKRGGIKVPERSGLNQWNAKGRPRNLREVYIPVPMWIHNSFPEFFPARDLNFNLSLPTGRILTAKICQDNGKALMSNPNADLGEWLLDDVLNVRGGDIVTYSMLEKIGVDSVEVEKIDDENFRINFKELGTFERFEEENKGIVFSVSREVPDSDMPIAAEERDDYIS